MNQQKPARGRGGGGRGRGPVGNRPQAMPLTTQVRQVESLLESEEMTLLRKIAKDLDTIVQIRSIHSLNGLVTREYRENAVGNDGQLIDRWLSAAEVDLRIHQKRAQEEHLRLLRRRSRLPENRRETPLSELTEEEMRIVRMSNTDYGRFRPNQQDGDSDAQSEASEAQEEPVQAQQPAAPNGE